MDIVVITGASAGLGTEFLEQIMRTMPLPDEIWLIARREERLHQLAAAYPQTTFRCLPLDLQKTESYDRYGHLLAESGAHIRLLINNAGYGKLGEFTNAHVGEQAGMVDLNCRATTAMTALSLPYMQRGSAVLNVCSIAAFAPTPRMTVYCSTKAFVYSFSKSLRRELRSQGINVMAVCPGPMSTEFLDVADIVGRSKTFQTLPYCNPKKVAAGALKRVYRRGIYTPHPFYKLYRVLAKLLPHGLVMYMSKT